MAGHLEEQGQLHLCQTPFRKVRLGIQVEE